MASRAALALCVLFFAQASVADGYTVSDADLDTIRQRCGSLTQGLQTAKGVPMGLFLMACEQEMRMAAEEIVTRVEQKRSRERVSEGKRGTSPR
jgi:hypothetical protein